MGSKRLTMDSFFVKNRLNLTGHPKKLTVKYSHIEKKKAVLLTKNNKKVEPIR